MMWRIITEGFALGLSLGVSCLGTCLPVFLPFLIAERRDLKKNILFTVYFLLGRFAGYIAFGAAFGALGGALDAGLRELITACAFIVLGGLLLYHTFKKHDEHCHSKLGKVVTHPSLLGLLLGISPCPTFLLGLSRAVSTGGAFEGAVFFTGFFFGTSVFYLPVSIFGEFGRLKFIRWLSKAVALLVGLWFLGNGLYTLGNRFFPGREGKYEVVEISDSDTVFIAGSEDLFVYLKDNYHHHGTLVLADSIPDGAWLFSFGERADSTALIDKGIKTVATEPDSAGVRRLAKFTEHHAFKQRPPQGFYYWIK